MGRTKGVRVGSPTGRKFTSLTIAMEPELKSFLQSNSGGMPTSIYAHGILKARMDEILKNENE